MARHFVYKHLPASGLGLRDPRRPYVSGGLGAGIPIFISIILEPYHTPGRQLDRDDGYAPPRAPSHGIRYSPGHGTDRSPVPGTVRSPSTVSRSTDPVYRTQPSQTARTPEDDERENYAEYSADIEDPNGA